MINEPAKPNRYTAIIEEIFKSHYKEGSTVIEFSRDELTSTADRLGIPLPKNLGDVLYSFRFRSNLPASILQTAKEGRVWLIRLAGRGEYRFEMVVDRPLSPNPSLVARKIPDATPGLITRYSLSDDKPS